jgi:hypothetical protein
VMPTRSLSAVGSGNPAALSMVTRMAQGHDSRWYPSPATWSLRNYGRDSGNPTQASLVTSTETPKSSAAGPE